MWLGFANSLSPYYDGDASPILFRYSAGDSIIDATFTRPSSATYRDSAGVVQSAASDALRDAHYEFDQVSGRYVQTVLLEGQRTNLSLNSSNLEGYSGFKAAAYTASVTAPDGSSSCTGITSELDATSDGVGHGIYRTAIPATGQPATFSIWMKAAEKNFGFVRFDDKYAYVDLATGASAADSGLTVRLERWPNGWWRVCATVDSYSGLSNDPFFGPAVAMTSDGAKNWIGDGGGIYAWGAQCEQGAFASSYIPTDISSVTRVADAFSFPYTAKPQAMTLYARLIDKGTTDADAGSRVFQVGTNGLDALLLYNSGSGHYSFWHYANDSSQATTFSRPAIGDSCEFVGKLLGTGAVGIELFSNESSISQDTNDTEAGIPASWSSPKLSIGFDSESGNQGFAAFRDLIIAKGDRPVDWFRSRASHAAPIRLFEYHAGESVSDLGGTFSRSSSATYRNAAGQIVTAASGTIRDNHYELDLVTGQYVRAVLLEGQRTNRALYSNDFSVPQWELFNGTTKVGIAPVPGPTGVANAYEIHHGASDSVFDGAAALYQQFIGASGDHTFSVWLRCAIGTTTVRIGISDGTSTSAVVTVTDQWQRFSVTRNLSGADANFSIRPNATGTSANVYVADAQLEAGAFSSSYIPTAGSAVTRAADSLSFPYMDAPRDMSFHIRYIDKGSGSGDGGFAIGNSAGAAGSLYVQPAFNLLEAYITGGGASVSSSGLYSLGDSVELDGRLVPGQFVQLGYAVNGASESFANKASATALASFAEQKIGTSAPNGTPPFAALRDIIVTSGQPGLSYFRSNRSRPA